MKLAGWLVLVGGVLGCGDKNTLTSTPAGTVLVSWDGTKAGDSLFDKATIGKRTAVTTTLVVHVHEREVKLKIVVEAAEVSRADIDKRYAPITVTATVEDSGDFTLSGGNCGALMIFDPDGGFKTKGAVVECGFGAERKTKHEGIAGGGQFVACGDGRVFENKPNVSSPDLCKVM